LEFCTKRRDCWWKRPLTAFCSYLTHNHVPSFCVFLQCRKPRNTQTQTEIYIGGYIREMYTGGTAILPCHTCLKSYFANELCVCLLLVLRAPSLSCFFRALSSFVMYLLQFRTRRARHELPRPPRSGIRPFLPTRPPWVYACRGDGIQRSERVEAGEVCNVADHGRACPCVRAGFFWPLVSGVLACGREQVLRRRYAVAFPVVAPCSLLTSVFIGDRRV